MEEPPYPLSYARVQERRFLRRHWRKLLLLSIGVGLAIALYGYRESLELRAKRLYWGGECLAHVTPPGTRLIVRDQTEAARLVARNPDYVMAHPYDERDRLEPYAIYFPRVWREFRRVEPRSVGFRPMLMSVRPRGDECPIVYMGERKSPGGNRRLVVIAGLYFGGNLFWDRVSYLVLPTPHPFESLPGPGISKKDFTYPSAEPVRLLPGVPDPQNRSHVAFPFEVLNHSFDAVIRHGTVDVYLLDDDTLEFRVRDPAATQGI